MASEIQCKKKKGYNGGRPENETRDISLTHNNVGGGGRISSREVSAFSSLGKGGPEGLVGEGGTSSIEGSKIFLRCKGGR